MPKVSLYDAATAVADTDFVPVVQTNPDGSLSTRRATVTQFRRTASGEEPQGVHLDSFTGADDDAKLTNAFAYASAQTYRPPIFLPSRRVAFAVTRQPYDGLRIIGPPGFNMPERNTQTRMTHRVALSMNGPWIMNTSGGIIYSVSLWQLSFTGGASASVISNDASSSYTGMHLRDISCSGLRSFAGTQTQALTMTACSWDGQWHISNNRHTAVHVKGSDCRLFTNGGLIDSAPDFHAEGGQPAGIAHIWCDSLDYSTIGGANLFITCEGPWRAIRHTGAATTANSGTTASNDGAVTYRDVIMQGRNLTQPCFGAVAKVEGGQAIFDACHFDFALSNPIENFAGDLGHIQHTGGLLDVIRPKHNRIPGQTPASKPLVYSSGTDCIGSVEKARTGTNKSGGRFTPVVRRVNGSTITVDNSVTLVMT